MSGSLVLIASYPKSGNTWVRIVFERILRGPSVPLGGLADGFQGALRRKMFDDFMPVNAADLFEDEVENCTPAVFRQLVSEIQGRAFVKVHESAHRTKLGDWLYPADCVSAAVYLVRHPFDVAVSAASHFNLSLEATVEMMARDRSLQRAYSWLTEPLPQFFGSWSENVGSWLDDAPYSVAFARYEDLHANGVAEFHRLARAVGIDATEKAVALSVEASRFSRLQEEESVHGFSEKPFAAKAFFREGRTRSWEGVLSKPLQEKIVRDHGAVMERLGYTASGDTLNMPVKWDRIAQSPS